MESVTSTNAGDAWRVQAGASLAHAMHDGMTDLVYLLLPAWQAAFGLDFAGAGVMRGLWAGAMALLQVPVAALSRRISPRRLLACGLLLAGCAWAFAGLATGIAGLWCALLLGGIASSAQHPLASTMVAHSAGAGQRRALSRYNVAGDLGKMVLPGLAGLALLRMDWRMCTLLVGGAGMLAGIILLVLLPARPLPAGPLPGSRHAPGPGPAAPLGSAFAALWMTGVLDSAVRMGFLTFLPFLLAREGAGPGDTGLALALVFAGGGAGKLACGFLGERLGARRTVWLTETATGVLILLCLQLPLTGILVLMPVLGIMLNGTSSVLYGTVPELVCAASRERAFAWFYSGTIGAGALAPVLFGYLADHVSLSDGVVVVAGMLLPTLLLIRLACKDLPASA